ncbi:50S ribosomal protein L25 [Candidatus Parcubacteria bacterium]|nr:MAG: 50S ribosomal protein L25 [Candidatus Parcubacteria bacterium]
MKREKLTVNPRTALGKKVKKLRKQGLIPANIYGKDIKSTAVELPLKEFINVFNKAHETGLVDLEFDKKTIPVLIYNVQVNPVTQEPLHADFYKVNLKEKITTNIPVVAVGEPLAVTEKKGILLNSLFEIEVEALPAELPEKIEINVENLKEVDEEIRVEDIKAPANVTILTDPNQVIFKIGELITKEAEEQAEAEEAEATEAAATQAPETEVKGEQPEGKKPEKGEQKPQEQPQEKKEE